MGAMKTSLLVSALTVLSLLVVSSASAKESGAKDPPPTDQGQTLGPGDETKRLQVSTGAMVAVQRRLALIEELEDIDEAIAALKQLRAELRQEWHVQNDERRKVEADIASAIRDIDDMNDAIDALEAAIITAALATLGAGTPELVAQRETLKSRRDTRRQQRDQMKSLRSQLNQTIARIDGKIELVEGRLQAKRQQKLEVKSQIAAVSITAPSEGARLPVGLGKKLMIRSVSPPKQIRIEIQHKAIRGGTANDDAVEYSWETLYDQTRDWKSLGSVSPDTVFLQLKPREKGSRTIHDPTSVLLVRGKYRARVQRIHEVGPGEGEDDSMSHEAGAGGTPSSMNVPWRSFEVIRRVSSEAFKRRPGGSGADELGLGKSLGSGIGKAQTLRAIPSGKQAPGVVKKPVASSGGPQTTTTLRPAPKSKHDETPEEGEQTNPTLRRIPRP